MSMLVRPSQVELSFTVCQGVVLTQVVVYQGTHLRGGDRAESGIDVYGDMVLIRKLFYQTLMVLHLSV